MASNWLYIDAGFPTFTGEESTDEKISTIQNYLYMLVEQLRYTLHNLDLSNMNTPAVNQFTQTLTDPIYAAIQDADDNLTQLAVTAAGIAARVSDAEGNIGTLQLTAKSLSASVSDAQGNISSLQMTAKSLSASLSDAQGNISSLQMTAKSLSASLSDAQGNISSLQMTASGLSTTVSNQSGQISALQVTASGLSASVSNQAGQISALQMTASGLSTTVSNQAGQISALRQTVNGFSLSVSNGSESSTLSLRSGGVVISSADITLTGMVTFSDLRTAGRTTINGGNITTGTITANNVGVSNRFSVYSGGWHYGYMGCGYGSDGNSYTYGAMLASANDRNYVIATNAGVRMTAGGSSLYCVPAGVHASSELIIDSDRRVKSDLSYDLERYEDFLLRLRPCVYRRRGEDARRLHAGFIAQDVEKALGDAGLAYEDFAALVKDPRLDPEYSLAYGEFIALNTRMIQRLTERVTALEKGGTTT